MSRRSITFDRLAFVGLLVAFLYVMLLDGFVRLRTGGNSVTILRDVAPGALLVFLAAHVAVKRRRWPRVPMQTLVLLWAAVAAVQVANPDALGIGRAALALRPHLEFVTLFFVAAVTLTTRRRLETFLLVLAFGAAANGAVSMYQSTLTPEQLGTWGAGYNRLVTQTASRTFENSKGVQTLRPPALGGDTGFGGVLGMLALPGALAILISGRGLRRIFAGVTIPFAVLGVLTSQTRATVVTAAIAVLAFSLLVNIGRGGRMLVPLGFIALLAVLVGNELLSGNVDLERYSTITPTAVAGTFAKERGGALGVIPKYAGRYPFGAGIGSAGPGTTVHASANEGKVTGENEFAYLIVETGVPGLIVMLMLFGSTLRRGLRLIKRATGEMHMLLCAGVASLIGAWALWLAGPMTAGPPASPFFWAIAGCFAALAVRTRRRSPAPPPSAGPVPADSPAAPPAMSGSVS